jgi:hypothetical protein
MLAKECGRTRDSLLSCLLVAAALTQASALAQGTFEVITTGGGPLTILRSGIIANSQSPFLQFQFGFATDEVIAPGVFLDSVTASLQPLNDVAQTVILFTVDRSGANWAPPSPGSLSIDPGSIQRQSIVFPSLTPQLTNRVAYEVTVAIPVTLRNRPLNLYFDLFDNQNSLRSLAWLGPFAPVPEPGWVGFAACGLVCWLFVRRCRQ